MKKKFNKISDNLLYWNPSLYMVNINTRGFSIKIDLTEDKKKNKKMIKDFEKITQKNTKKLNTLNEKKYLKQENIKKIANYRNSDEKINFELKNEKIKNKIWINNLNHYRNDYNLNNNNCKSNNDNYDSNNNNNNYNSNNNNYDSNNNNNYNSNNNNYDSNNNNYDSNNNKSRDDFFKKLFNDFKENIWERIQNLWKKSKDLVKDLNKIASQYWENFWNNIRILIRIMLSSCMPREMLIIIIKYHTGTFLLNDRNLFFASDDQLINLATDAIINTMRNDIKKITPLFLMLNFLIYIIHNNYIDIRIRMINGLVNRKTPNWTFNPKYNFFFLKKLPTAPLFLLSRANMYNARIARYTNKSLIYIYTQAMNFFRRFR